MGKPLSPRQRQVAEMAATGMTDKEIAIALGLSDGSIKVYIRDALRKLGIERRQSLPITLNQPLLNAREVVLTAYQLFIASRMAEGLSAAGIAQVPGVRYHSVKYAVKQLYQAVGVGNATGLVAWYLARHGQPTDFDPDPDAALLKQVKNIIRDEASIDSAARAVINLVRNNGHE